jgi:hypothetical protein
VAQIVESLPSKYEAVRSNPSTAKKEKSQQIKNKDTVFHSDWQKVFEINNVIFARVWTKEGILSR